MSLIGPEGRRQLRLAGRFAATGFELAISILVGYFAGEWVGKKLGLPYLWIFGLALGVVAGFRSLFRTAKTAQREANEPLDDHPSDPGEPSA